MSVSIWEGNKAQELIDAVKGKNNFPQEVSAALLNCFQNVVWVNGNGETYYNALAEALDYTPPEPGPEPTPTPEAGFDNIMLYKASSGELLTGYQGTVWTGSGSGNAVETLSDGILSIVPSTNPSYIMMRLAGLTQDLVGNNVKMEARIKINGNITTTGSFVFVCGPQSKKTSIIFSRNNKVSRYGNDSQFIDVGAYTANEWMTFAIESINGVQQIKLNDSVLYSGASSTFGESSQGIVFTDLPSSVALNIDTLKLQWSNPS